MPAILRSFAVLIPDGESPFALPVIQCLAKESNIQIHLLANCSWPRARFSKYVSKYHKHSVAQSNEERVKFLEELLQKEEIDVLLPVDEPSVRWVSEHRLHFERYTALAPIPQTKTFDKAVNKWTLAEWAVKEQLPCPTTLLFENNNSFVTKISELQFPVLIKPIQGSGGVGIAYFENKNRLMLGLKDRKEGSYIIQSYLKGYDIDCSVLAQDGVVLGYTIQKRCNTSKDGFAPAGNIDFVQQPEVFELVTKAVKKLNWSGVVHFDLRYDEDDDEIKIIEMNCRFWASTLASLVAGVNFPYIACRVALGHTVSCDGFTESRFVNGISALKILLKKYMGRSRVSDFFDASSLEFIKADFMPVLFDKFSRLFKTKKATN